MIEIFKFNFLRNLFFPQKTFSIFEMKLLLENTPLQNTILFIQQILGEILIFKARKKLKKKVRIFFVNVKNKFDKKII